MGLKKCSVDGLGQDIGAGFAGRQTRILDLFSARLKVKKPEGWGEWQALAKSVTGARREKPRPD
jgi:hypothetical protein